MRLVYMGTPDFAVPALEALKSAGHEICLVVSQPDKPVGRHAQILPTPVKQKAQELGLKVLQPQKATDPDFIDVLRKLEPDAIVVAAYGKILRPQLLSIPKLGCINIHASLLPKYRGAAPIQWAVFNGDAESGLTIMKMAEGMDTGDILMQKRIPLDKAETGGTLFEKLSKLSGPFIVEAMKKLETGELKPQVQKDEDATMAPPLTKEMSVIDPLKTAVEIERQVRAFDPWPGTTVKLGDKRLKILKAEAVPGLAAKNAKDHNPGDIFIDGKDLYLKCKEGLLKILMLQLEGKKKMPAEEFLKGNRELFS